MARGGINKAVVQAARMAILARGDNPSIDAVRIEMGNTGSKTTIHRYLKELDDEVAARQSEPQEQIDDELTGLVARLAQRLREQGQERIDQALEGFEQARKALESQLAEALQLQAQLTHQLQTQGATLASESAALHDTRALLQGEQTRNAGLSQALSDFELRLNDKDEQIRSLEEKHLHARDALEHYREAIKDQREQEQRRHEGQVQQIQMELRQAQQSAMVRQDEITQLNRDNERLLTENRGTVRELHLLQDQLKHSETRQAQAQEQIRRNEAEATLLQERLRVAVLESTSAKQAASEHLQANVELERRAASAEASLQALHQAVAKQAAPEPVPVPVPAPAQSEEP
ncbi:DNA-binding protein [Pseudomonas kielensis]|uniref:DNA-binding protein n=1 Tax=Pseudomonas kielensis TaxID=2762577 RepID=A0A7X1GAH1_9PSED|nr:DNA-binding protein [Pseudomonas kielensis]MBC2688902.1 DNA-binding protein [Pseudomonas kielensis]